MSLSVPGLAAEQRAAIGAALGALVADLTALALNASQAHWHVTGLRARAVADRFDIPAPAARKPNYTV